MTFLPAGKKGEGCCDLLEGAGGIAGRSPGAGWRTFLLPAAHCHPESEAEIREAEAWYLENAASLGEAALRRRARRQILLGVLAVALGILLGLLWLP